MEIKSNVTMIKFTDEELKTMKDAKKVFSDLLSSMSDAGLHKISIDNFSITYEQFEPVWEFLNIMTAELNTNKKAKKENSIL